MQKFDRAHEMFEKAVENDGNFDYAYNNLGMLDYEKNDYVTAHSWLEKAFALNPNNFTTINNLAVVHFMEQPENPARAFELLKKASELNPNFRMAFYNLGFIAVFTHKV